MPGDLVNVLNLHLSKSDARLILKRIRLLEQQRRIARQFLLQDRTFKEYLGTDAFDTMIKHFEEEVAYLDERIRAYERILEAAQRKHNDE
jgi:hypothetical protein